jgi:hypothetical protein
VIHAKIQSHGDGVDEAEAFKALRVGIERMMDRLLQDVPNLVDLQPESTIDGARSVDRPPAYAPG